MHLRGAFCFSRSLQMMGDCQALDRLPKEADLPSWLTLTWFTKNWPSSSLYCASPSMGTRSRIVGRRGAWVKPLCDDYDAFSVSSGVSMRLERRSPIIIRNYFPLVLLRGYRLFAKLMSSSAIGRSYFKARCRQISSSSLVVTVLSSVTARDRCTGDVVT